MDNNNSSSKTLLAIGAGLIVGGAVGYYLNSERGRKMRDDTLNTVQNQLSTTANKLTEVTDNLQSRFDNIADATKEKLESFAENMANNK
jgi:gas vesicle protein